MKKLLAGLVILSVCLVAASWQKVGNDYQVTKTTVGTMDQQAAYDAKQGSLTRQNLLGRLGCASLTQADAGHLRSIVHALAQGVSIADQKTAIDTTVSEIPNVPKPIEVVEVEK